MSLVFLILLMAPLGKGQAKFNYFVSIWPLVMALFGGCLWAVAEWLGNRLKGRAGLAAVLVVLPVAAYLAVPAWASVE